MRIAAISDLHGYLPELESLPDADVLVIAGDVCPLSDHRRQYQAWFLRGVFRPWLEAAQARYQDLFWIAGNHDFVLQESAVGRELPGYVQDEGRTIGGYRFWGSPWSPTFGRWAFMRPDDEILYPGDDQPRVDVMVSHTPPRGACDLTDYYVNPPLNVGSLALRGWVETYQPHYVICGHIHEGYGSAGIGATSVFNVAVQNVRYEPVNQPAVLVLP